MKKLAVCIPNYNRPQKLGRLLEVLAKQIVLGNLSDEVEICINDDCSTEKPDDVIRRIKKMYPDIFIRYEMNERNMGMDYNFLRSVMLSDSEYCWIVGNDDLPGEAALKEILGQLNVNKKDIDVLVCPFDLYDENDHVWGSVYPLRGDITGTLYFDTRKKEEYDKLIERINDGNALFCFLSNVVFKKVHWSAHGNMFEDKMNTIFIQMYMNLQTLQEGAVYAYTPFKFIKNYSDDEVNATFKREYDVLVGLSGVIDYFFQGREHKKLQKCIVDPRINGRMWDLPDDSPLKQSIIQIDSSKNDLYKAYFIQQENREMFFKGKDVLLYGAGHHGQKAILELKDYCPHSLDVFDADQDKWGKQIEGYEIKPAEMLYKAYDSKKSIVVVANQLYLEDIISTMRDQNVGNFAIIT